jgi:nitrate/nitrite-specific signal transduction histidine kinase
VPAFGFEPELTFEGPLDSTVPEKSAPEVLAVLREALSNVARHARASHAQASLTADPSRWTLTLLIEDDGVGPGPDDVPGLGTATMAARARRLGGGCSTWGGGRRASALVGLPGRAALIAGPDTALPVVARLCAR